MAFRKETIDSYALIFNGSDGSDSENNADEDFADKWSWFGVMYRLTNGEIVNLEAITKLNLYECLTWLSYETDLNDTKMVNRDDKQ